MARLWQAGFEENSITTLIWTGIDGSPTISSTTVRSGTYAGRISSLGSGAIQAFRFNYASANTDGPLFFRQYLYIAALPSAENRIVRMSNSAGSFTVYLTLDNAGLLKLYDEDGQIGSSTTLSTGAWYRLEIQYDRTPAAGSHIVNALVDGTQFAGSTARNLSSGVVSIRWGGNLNAEANTAGDWFWDDLAINDNTGSFQTSYPGSGKIVRLSPTAAGDANSFATQTGGTAGSGNNFTRVNEVTPDDATTLNGSSTLNQEDLFNVANSGIGSADVVNVVTVHGRFRNNVADATAVLKFEIEKAAGGTILQSAAITPNSTTWMLNKTAVPRFPSIVAHQDPDGTNWTQTTIDSMQIGYKLTTANVNRIDVSTVWAYVDYTPVLDFDIAGSSGDVAAASSYSGSASWRGSNRALCIDVSMLGPGVTVTAMTYGGANCTFIGSKSTVTSLGGVECWRITAADSGAPAAGANTLSVTLSGSLEFTVEWVSYTGVHQTSPTEGFDSAQATNAGSATDASVAITTVADNDWVHAAVVANDTAITANQISRNNIPGTLGSGANEDNGAPKVAAGAVTMSYSGMGITTTWAIAGYALRDINAPSLGSTFPGYYGGAGWF